MVRGGRNGQSAAQAEKSNFRAQRFACDITCVEPWSVDRASSMDNASWTQHFRAVSPPTPGVPLALSAGLSGSPLCRLATHDSTPSGARRRKIHRKGAPSEAFQRTARGRTHKVEPLDGASKVNCKCTVVHKTLAKRLEMGRISAWSFKGHA